MNPRLTLLALAIAALPLSGCNSLAQANNFKPAESSGADPGTLAIAFTKNLDTIPTSGDADFDAAIGKCGVSITKPSAVGPQVAPFVVSIVAALIKFISDDVNDHRQRRIDQIVKATQQTYTKSLAVDPARLAGATCLIVTRTTPGADGKPDKPGLVAILGIEHSPAPQANPAAPYSSFLLHPKYVRVFRAVALTKAETAPTITVALSAAIKAVGRAPTGGGVPVLMPSGVSSVEIDDVPIGDKAAASCTDGKCEPSELIPYPTDRGLVSLNVAITEQGVKGFDDKVASAELASIKAALGPALSDAITAQWGK